MPQLAEVGRDQRIGRRNRRIGNADIVRREAEQRVLEVVSGENDDRTLGGQIAREQRGADAPYSFEGLRVSRGAPALARALRHEYAIGRDTGPMHQAIGQLVGICGQRA
jgi:hypothetical protein